MSSVDLHVEKCEFQIAVGLSASGGARPGPAVALAHAPSDEIAKNAECFASAPAKMRLPWLGRGDQKFLAPALFCARNLSSICLAYL